MDLDIDRMGSGGCVDGLIGPPRVWVSLLVFDLLIRADNLLTVDVITLAKYECFR